MANFKQTWHKASLGQGNSGFKFIQIKDPILFQWEIIAKIHWRNLNIFFLKHPWVVGIQVCSKGPALFQGRLFQNKEKYTDKILKIYFFRTTGLISIKLCTKHTWVIGIKFCSVEGPHPFPRGGNHKRTKKLLSIFKNLLLQNRWANFN